MVQRYRQKLTFEKTISSRIKPKLSGNIMDVSNFDKMFTDGEAIHSVMPKEAMNKINSA